MLSKAASSTIFWVFGMTQPGIEPWSSGQMADTLLIRPKSYKKFTSQMIEVSSLLIFLWCEGFTWKKKWCVYFSSLVIILLYDNGRPHVARMTMVGNVARMTLQNLTDLGYETLPHPPYSSDLSSTNYHFFKHPDTFFNARKHSVVKEKKLYIKISWDQNILKHK